VAPPQNSLWELTVLPRPPAVFRGLLLKGGEERGREEVCLLP